MKKLNYISLIIPLLTLGTFGYTIYSLFFAKSDSDKTTGLAVANRQQVQDQIDSGTDDSITPQMIDMAIDRAIRISENLGISYSWYNPRNWTENDETVFNILVPLNDTEIELVKVAYSKNYNRDLVTDLTSYLDSEYFNLLKDRL